MSKLDNFIKDLENILLKNGFERDIFVVNMDTNEYLGDLSFGRSEDDHLMIGISLSGENGCPHCAGANECLGTTKKRDKQ